MRRLLSSILFGLILGYSPFSGQAIYAQETDEQSERGSWPEPIFQDPELAERRELLLSHGVNPQPEEMIYFLNEGFSEKQLLGELPETPVLKSEIVNACIEELGVTGSVAAVPVLTQLVQKEFPPGVDRIVRMDFESVPIDEKKDAITFMKRALCLNSITALGYIGESAPIPVVLEAIRSETGTIFTTKGGISLGLMGSNEGIGPLVLLASEIESPSAVAAFDALYILTGQNYGVTQNTSLARRQLLLSQLKDWYEKEGAEAPVYRAEVLRRMKAPRITPQPDSSTLRGLLRMSRDVSSFEKRYAATEKLKGVAAERFDDLKSICLDEMEDLDIRRAAMLYLSGANPKKARRVLDRLEDDQNQSIAQYSISLQKDVREALEAN